MTACLQGFHDTHFVFGGNAGEDGSALDQLTQLLGIQAIQFAAFMHLAA